MFNDIAHFWVVEVTRINVSDTGENGNGPSGRSWDLDIIGNARQAVDESFDRYLRAIGVQSPVPVCA